jgi:hypothetical protein
MIPFAAFEEAFPKELSLPSFGQSVADRKEKEPDSLSPAAKEISRRNLNTVFGNRQFLRSVYALIKEHDSRVKEHARIQGLPAEICRQITKYRNTYKGLAVTKWRISSLYDNLEPVKSNVPDEVAEAIENLTACQEKLRYKQGLLVARLKPCLRSLGRRLFQTNPPSPFFSIGPIDQAPAGPSRCTVCGTEKLAERHLRIRMQSKGSVNYISGGFCETNPLSVFVSSGKKRGPTSVLQLQSSSLASGFAERVPDLHHGLLRTNWRFRNKKDVSVGDRVFLLLQGKHGPAIIGYGKLTRAGGTDWRGIEFEALEDPEERVLAGRRRLQAIRGSAPWWRTPASGVCLPGSLAEKLESLVVRRKPRTANDSLPLNRHVTTQGIFEASEGRLLLRKHFARERDGRLVASKRNEALHKYGKLPCEVCNQDFVALYGSRGVALSSANTLSP